MHGKKKLYRFWNTCKRVTKGNTVVIIREKNYIYIWRDQIYARFLPTVKLYNMYDLLIKLQYKS